MQKREQRADQREKERIKNDILLSKIKPISNDVPFQQGNASFTYSNIMNNYRLNIKIFTPTGNTNSTCHTIPYETGNSVYV